MKRSVSTLVLSVLFISQPVVSDTLAHQAEFLMKGGAQNWLEPTLETSFEDCVHTRRFEMKHEQTVRVVEAQLDFSKVNWRTYSAQKFGDQPAFFSGQCTEACFTLKDTDKGVVYSSNEFEFAPIQVDANLFKEPVKALIESCPNV